MKRSDYSFIFTSFVIWLAVIFLILLFAIGIVPLQKEFLGGGPANYLSSPFLWTWSNFDGVHYVAIAQNGYQPLTYFFFPLYPVMVKFFSGIFGGGIVSLAKSGLLVSYLSLVAALIGLYKLLKLDFGQNLVRNSILLLLIFPTSFYFGSIYTESLFLALTIWSFYLARRRNWIPAGVLGALATATRVVGVALVVAIAVEAFLAWKADKKIKLFQPILAVVISMFGIGIYVYYVWTKTGDPLNFINSVGIFGAQRSSSLILLPQVFYRYIFKVLPNINYMVLTSFFPSVLEFVVGILFLGLAVLSFWKLRPSYAIFLTLGYLIPTLSGSFSSLPRYVLILFPAFVLMAQLLKRSKVLLLAFATVSFILLIISFSLFARGYWIS